MVSCFRGRQHPEAALINNFHLLSNTRILSISTVFLGFVGIAFGTPLAYLFAMIFIETPIFTKCLRGLLDDESYADFQQALAHRPDMGDVIQGK